MSLPGFTADTSLYRTSRSYRGSPSGLVGDAGPTIVAQQFGCEFWCFVRLHACNAGCAASPFPPACLALCGIAWDACMQDCNPSPPLH